MRQIGKIKVVGALVVVGLALAVPISAAGAVLVRPYSPEAKPSSIGKAQATFDDPVGQPDDNFGDAVARSGSTVLIGASGTENEQDGDQGVAYLYTKGPSGWPATPTATFAGAPECGKCYFGSSVALSGNTAIIGADGSGDDMYIGNAYIFVKGPSGCPATPTVTLDNPVQGFYNYFGYSVSISGNTAIVGAFGSVGNGMAYIYAKGPSGWPSQPTVTLSDPGDSSNNDEFGYSVSISENTAIVGAPETNTTKRYAGKSYVYTKGPTGWPDTPTTTLTDPDGVKWDQFGDAVSVSGTTAFISAVDVPKATVQQGAVYIYEETDSGWKNEPKATLADPNKQDDDNFGYRLSLSASTSAIARLNIGTSVAEVYIFDNGAAGWPAKPTATLDDPGDSSHDQFGYSVASSSGSALIGAPGGDGGAGLAYLFKASSST